MTFRKMERIKVKVNEILGGDHLHLLKKDDCSESDEYENDNNGFY